MLFNPGKMTSTSRLLFEQNIAMTIVGFPATALLSARARVCISASHTRQDLDWALQVSGPLPSPPALWACHLYRGPFGSDVLPGYQQSCSRVRVA